MQKRPDPEYTFLRPVTMATSHLDTLQTLSFEPANSLFSLRSNRHPSVRGDQVTGRSSR